MYTIYIRKAWRQQWSLFRILPHCHHLCFCIVIFLGQLNLFSPPFPVSFQPLETWHYVTVVSFRSKNTLSLFARVKRSLSFPEQSVGTKLTKLSHQKNESARQWGRGAWEPTGTRTASLKAPLPFCHRRRPAKEVEVWCLLCNFNIGKLMCF